LTKELNLNIGRKLLIVNRVKDGQSEIIEKAVKEYQLDLIGIIPEDTQLRDFDLHGRPIIELGMESIALEAAYQVFEKTLEN